MVGASCVYDRAKRLSKAPVQVIIRSHFQFELVVLPKSSELDGALAISLSGIPNY